MTNPPLRSDEPMTREGCSVCGAADALPTNRGRRLCIRCSAPDNVIEVDRLTRALEEMTARVAELEREVSDHNDAWARQARVAECVLPALGSARPVLTDEEYAALAGLVFIRFRPFTAVEWAAISAKAAELEEKYGWAERMAERKKDEV